MASATLNPKSAELTLPRATQQAENVQTLARIEGAQDRTEEASFDRFDTLHHLHHARIFRFLVVQSRDADLAETLTQETFLRAWTSRAQFRGDCSMNTWLMRIALNLLRDHTRTNRFRFWKRAAAAPPPGEEDLLPHLPARTGSQENHLIAQQQVALVWATVSGLSERQRTVFHLRFVEEMELSEIAGVMQVPLSTVKTHLYRALGTIRQRHAHIAPGPETPAVPRRSTNV